MLLSIKLKNFNAVRLTKDPLSISDILLWSNSIPAFKNYFVSKGEALFFNKYTGWYQNHKNILVCQINRKKCKISNCTVLKYKI